MAVYYLVMLGTPLPLRSIGIMELEENLKLISERQQVTGKILSCKDLLVGFSCSRDNGRPRRQGLKAPALFSTANTRLKPGSSTKPSLTPG